MNKAILLGFSRSKGTFVHQLEAYVEEDSLGTFNTDTGLHEVRDMSRPR